MAANALVQTRIDADVKAKATEVLDKLGLTVSDAVRIFLTRTANEGALPFPVAGNAEHDEWFRRKVIEALEHRGHLLSNDQVKQRFAAKRAAAAKISR